MDVTERSPAWQLGLEVGKQPLVMLPTTSSHLQDGTMGSPRQHGPGMQGNPFCFPWGFGVPSPQLHPHGVLQWPCSHTSPPCKPITRFWGSPCFISSSSEVAVASPLQGTAVGSHQGQIRCRANPPASACALPIAGSSEIKLLGSIPGCTMACSMPMPVDRGSGREMGTAWVGMQPWHRAPASSSSMAG